MRRYVFSEFTPLAELLRAETLALLRGEELLVYVAIGPELRSKAAEIVGRCRDAGVAVGLWPLLEDERGRWASDWNARDFADECRELVSTLDAADRVPDELILDLEPPIAATKRILAGRPLSLRERLANRMSWPTPRRSDGAAILDKLVRELRPLCPVSAVVVPWAVAGRGARGWQRALGTPVDGIGFDRVFIMAYTSLLEGYSRGALERKHAEALLDHWSRALVAARGARAGVAIGVAGVGALGDEQTYREPAELSRDVSIAAAAGCEHIALFNLRGVLSRPDPDAWLEAFRSPAAALAPPPSRRVQGVLGILDATGRALALRR